MTLAIRHLCRCACAGAIIANAVNAQDTTHSLQIAASEPRFLSAPAPGAPAVDVSTAPALQRRVTLELNRVPLGAALNAISRQTGLHFGASRQLVPLAKSVSMSAADITVAAALFELLMGAGVDVELAPDGTTLWLVPRNGVRAPGRWQGTGQIAGRIIDAATGGPLDQVAVRVEGPGLGAVTASDGRYSVRGILAGTYRVTARRVGYTPLTKTVTAATDSTVAVDFALAGAPTKLTEVVTTAVGDQRRYEVGSVISTINADSIAPTAPITSLTDLVSARSPGVTVEETGGLTGSGEAIRIRGQSSLVLQGDPIVIVDGVRQDNTPGGTAALPPAGFGSTVVPSPSRLNDLNVNDIQSIDILKGPSASTEYGTDAANGVVVVTTKHGMSGHPQWRASAEMATSELPEHFPTKYYSWGHTTDPSHTPVNCPFVPSVFGSGYGSATGTCAVDSVTTWNPLNNPSYSIFGTGGRQAYDLSLSGGSEAVRYFAAGRLSNETGILRLPGAFTSQAEAVGLPRSAFRPNGEEQRSVRANTAIRLGSTADLTVSGAYLATYQKTPNAQDLIDGVTRSLALRDSATVYGYSNNLFATPVYQFGLPTSETTNRLTGGLTANWRPALWLVGHGTVGIDHGSLRNQEAILPQISMMSFYPAQLGIENATTDIYTVDLRASATATLARTVRAVTSVGAQLADSRLQGITVVATGVTATNFTLNGAVSPTVTQLGDRRATLGGYGEEELGFSDRFFVTGALRVDAGSGFGRDYSTAAYPKASISWLAINSGATTVRARGAFGESGVQPPNGAALALYAPATAWHNGGLATGVEIANVSNPRLQPERSAEYEGGIDLGLWQGRVSVEVTGYSKTTHRALVNVVTGWEAASLPYAENVGEVRNVGLEGVIAATIVRARAVAWDATLTAAINHNKLLALAPGVLTQELFGYTALYRFVPSYPLYGYWGPRARYTDLNHDGVLEPSEVTVSDSLSYVGSSLPTREASLATHIGVLGGVVAIGALLDYRGGFRLANVTALNEANVQSDLASNARSAPLWQQARDVASHTIDALGLDSYADPAGFYEDATYLRFRELSLTYVLPSHLVRALRVRNVAITAAVRNLALWTRYTGTDPEVTNSSGINAQLSPTSNTYVVNNDLRADGGAVPLVRHWLVRLNMGL